MQVPTNLSLLTGWDAHYTTNLAVRPFRTSQVHSASNMLPNFRVSRFIDTRSPFRSGYTKGRSWLHDCGTHFMTLNGINESLRSPLPYLLSSRWSRCPIFSHHDSVFPKTISLGWSLPETIRLSSGHLFTSSKMPKSEVIDGPQFDAHLSLHTANSNNNSNSDIYTFPLDWFRLHHSTIINTACY